MVRRQLGRRLRRLREAAGKTAADVAQAGIASKAKLSRVENGWSVVKMADVRTMCWLYGADPATTDRLGRMALGTSGPGWWEEHSGDPADRLYTGLEAQASRLCCYEPELVPPLLQTPDYLRAVAGASAEPGDPATRQAELSNRVQAQLERAVPLQVCAVLDAGVLGRVVGGSEVMTAQTRRLLQQNRLPQVEIRVLPWSAGAHAAMRGAFCVLEFADPEDPTVACVETLTGTRYAELPTEVARYRRVFASIWRQSMSLGQYLAGGLASPAIDLRSGAPAPPREAAVRSGSQ